MATNFCPQCGREVSADDRFCPSCGASLAGEAPPPPRTTAGPSRMPLIIIALGAIGLLLIAGGFLLDGEDNPPAIAEPPAVPATARPENTIPFPDVPRIALDDAAMSQMSGDALFVDVREPDDYAEAHIPDAISIPLGDAGLDPAYRDLSQDSQIITYCT